ncbi:MAG TPA: DUF5318 family protein [Acidimicrobiales bacterium]
MTATSGPGEPRPDPAPAGDARVEYRLARNAVVRDVQRGKLGRVDVCDAHPELLRAARNVGQATGESCPICNVDEVVEVTFVFGARLPPGGRCPGSATELNRLKRRVDPVTCYAVEVCPSCAWHHLARRYSAGGRNAPRRRAVGAAAGGTTPTPGARKRS